MDLDPAHAQRTQDIHAALADFAVVTADAATADLLGPLTFLLTQVRRALGMDVVFVSRFVDQSRVFEVVSCEGEKHPLVAPGNSDPLVDTYCKLVAEGRLPAVVADTSQNDEVRALAITRRLDIGAYLSAPVLLGNGRVFGTICCISHSRRPDLQAADAKALEAVAEAVAASVNANGKVRFASWVPPD